MQGLTRCQPLDRNGLRILRPRMTRLPRHERDRTRRCRRRGPLALPWRTMALGGPGCAVVFRLPNMNHVFCWRCRRWVRTLNDNEYQQAHALLRALKDAHRETDSGTISRDELERRLAALHEVQVQLSDGENVSLSELLRHRPEYFGPPCSHCGKNLRTPRARMCVACGQKRVS